MLLPLHILSGGLALLFGYVALYAAKGATLHRKSGMLFVYAMVTLSLSGALMEALNKSVTSVNVVAGLLTFYFVTTALLTVRPRLQASSSIDRVWPWRYTPCSKPALTPCPETRDRRPACG